MNDLLKEIQRLKRENLKLKRQLEAIRKIIFSVKDVRQPVKNTDKTEIKEDACTAENP